MRTASRRVGGVRLHPLGVQQAFPLFTQLPIRRVVFSETRAPGKDLPTKAGKHSLAPGSALLIEFRKMQ
jgi:hypothetical protein